MADKPKPPLELPTGYDALVRPHLEAVNTARAKHGLGPTGGEYEAALRGFLGVEAADGAHPHDAMRRWWDLRGDVSRSMRAGAEKHARAAVKGSDWAGSPGNRRGAWERAQAIRAKAGREYMESRENTMLEARVASMKEAAEMRALEGDLEYKPPAAIQEGDVGRGPAGREAQVAAARHEISAGQAMAAQTNLAADEAAAGGTREGFQERVRSWLAKNKGMMGGEEGAVTFGGDKPKGREFARGILERIAAGDDWLAALHGIDVAKAQDMLSRLPDEPAPPMSAATTAKARAFMAQNPGVAPSEIASPGFTAKFREFQARNPHLFGEEGAITWNPRQTAEENARRFFDPDTGFKMDRGDLMTYMSPDEFARLAAPLSDISGIEGPLSPPREASLRDVRAALAADIPLDDLPFLEVDRSGQVTGHEGRHRARVLRELGVPKMPVIIGDDEMRFAGLMNYGPLPSHMVSPWDPDYRGALPERILGEPPYAEGDSLRAPARSNPYSIESPFYTEGPLRGTVRPEYAGAWRQQIAKLGGEEGAAEFSRRSFLKRMAAGAAAAKGLAGAPLPAAAEVPLPAAAAAPPEPRYLEHQDWWESPDDLYDDLYPAGGSEYDPVDVMRQRGVPPGMSAAEANALQTSLEAPLSRYGRLRSQPLYRPPALDPPPVRPALDPPPAQAALDPPPARPALDPPPARPAPAQPQSRWAQEPPQARTRSALTGEPIPVPERISMPVGPEAAASQLTGRQALRSIAAKGAGIAAMPLFDYALDPDARTPEQFLRRTEDLVTMLPGLTPREKHYTLPPDREAAVEATQGMLVQPSYEEEAVTLDELNTYLTTPGRFGEYDSRMPEWVWRMNRQQEDAGQPPITKTGVIPSVVPLQTPRGVTWRKQKTETPSLYGVDLLPSEEEEKRRSWQRQPELEGTWAEVLQ